jgi:PKHD-type hydroxylase
MNNAPRFPIPRLSFPNISYCEYYRAFSPEELFSIREMGELMIFKPGAVGNNEMVPDVRDSDIAWIDDNGNPDVPALGVRLDLIRKLQHHCGVVNRDKFQLDVDYFFPPQYTRYQLNQHYDWHCDVDEGSENEDHRKLSAVLMVTGPNDYEGGELELNIGGNPDKTLLLKPEAGTIVFFRSSVPHRVRPVTAGDRHSVVLWGMGPKSV